MNNLRIFISSPGDVAEERERARQVVQGLARRYARHFALVPVLWEEMPLTLDNSFQHGIDFLLSKDFGIDIAVFILWSRLGSPLGARLARSDGREYRSGTERELDLMLEARARQGGQRPHILAYARQDEATFEEQLRGRSTAEKAELLRQKELVEEFIREEFHDEATGTNLRAYHTYHRPQSFSERLRAHLQEILDGFTDGQPGKPAWDIDQRGPPFLGLQSFKYEHAEVFFGREAEVSESRLRLAEVAKRGTAFLLVSGGSGTGKSSLAAAGIVPEIVAHETDESVGRWLHMNVAPASMEGDPAIGIARVVTQAVPTLVTRDDIDNFIEALRKDPVLATKLVLLPALKAQVSKPGAVRIVILVDQLEELFTDPRFTDESRDLFARILEAFATSGQIWIVATIRGDFYHRLLGCPGLVRLATAGAQLPLVPPGADALRRIIESPSLLSGVSFERVGETTLADRILRDVSEQAELLPLLEDLLRELFERRSADGVLSITAYESLGGIEGALAKRAEASLARLPCEVQLAFPEVMRKLVATGDGPDGAAVRRRVELESFPVGTSARSLVEGLVADRLATASARKDGTPEVSIAHEAILRVWPRAASWIQENEEFLKLRDRLATRMSEGAPLSAADPLVSAARTVLESWRDSFEPELVAYVDRQLAAIDAERKRQVRGRRIAVGVVAATLVAIVFGGVVMQDRAKRQERVAQAEGAVETLLKAGSAQISAAVESAADPLLVSYARPKLARAFAAARSTAEKVRAAIGLVRMPEVDEGVWDSLADSLLTAEPGEVVVIREALRPRAERLREKFWDRARSLAAGGERLRAAAVLAEFDPDGEPWSAIAAAVAGDLVTVPAVHLATWLEALRGVRGLLVPKLVSIFADPQRRDVERSLAADILADYASDNPVVLADLTVMAEPDQFSAVAKQVEARFADIGPLLEAVIEDSVTEDLDLVAQERETLGIRKAKAAAVLVRFGQLKRVWPLFVHAPDPRVRSYLVHFVGPFGVNPEPLLERLAVEQDLSAQRALVLAIGDMADARVLAACRSHVVARLREIFRSDPDPGLHAAAAWTLRQFGDDEWLAAWQLNWREEAAAVGPLQLEAILQDFAVDGPRAPRWFVNGQGQTLVAVPGPVEFLMGSPESEAGREKDEIRHRRRIGRSFAIGAAPVTLGEYDRLIGGGEYGKQLADELGPRFARSPSLPVLGQNWFMAAAYCNALSEAEGIAKSEWVYEHDEKGELRLAEGWLDRSGYRLPTESEWEYASRAGAVTSRFYGETAMLLGDYAWHIGNSTVDGQSAPWPVAVKKPNDLGLYDALGNVWNWCQDEYERYPIVVRGDVVEDVEGDGEISREGSRVLRGGSFVAIPSRERSAYRLDDVPSFRNFYYYGLRVARTLVPLPIAPTPVTD
jgi:formylglycine-generating enzyme required for sulfatase activity